MSNILLSLQGPSGKNGEPGAAVTIVVQIKPVLSSAVFLHNISSVFQGLRGPPGLPGPQGPAGHNVSLNLKPVL